MTSPFPARRVAVPPFVFVLLAGPLAAPARAQNHDAVDEIIVTGVPRDRSAGELAQPVAVVGGDELDRVRAGTLGETLANQLGVTSSYFGAGASRPIIRGLAGARVQMLEDGLGTMDVATVSDDHAVTVEPLAADQIEIFRGPATLLYGSGAVGGVVNTVTARIPGAVPEDGFEGAAELRSDTAAEARGLALRLDGGGSRFAWHLDGGRRRSDDYDIPGFAHAGVDAATAGADEAFGLLPNSAAESDSAAFGASWLTADGFIGIGINAFDTLYGIPSHHDDREQDNATTEEPQTEEGAVRIDLTQRRLDVRGSFDGLSSVIDSLNVRFGVNDYEHVELEGDAVGTRFTNDAMELRVELLHRAAGRWSGAFGMQAGERKFIAIGEEAFVPPVDGESIGVFLVEDVDLMPWQLSLGGRVESGAYRPSNGSPRFDDTASSFSLGAVRSFGAGYAFMATLARSERLPVAEELYSNGPHVATGVVQIGDPTLAGETAQHVDVGFRGRMGPLNWTVTTFHTQYDDFIYLAASGAADPVEGLPIFVYAQADADFSGAEAEVFLPLLAEGSNEIDLRLYADYVRGELTSGEPLPRLPPLRYGARLEYHNSRLLVGLEGTRYDDQDDVAAFEEETAGYFMLNADLRWRFVGVTGAELEMFVNATNLYDEEARKHTSFVKDVAPLPGRNYSLGFRSRF